MLLCTGLVHAIGKLGDDPAGDINALPSRWVHRLCSRSKRHGSKMFIVACRVGGFAKVGGFEVLICHALARATGRRGADMIGDIMSCFVVGSTGCAAAEGTGCSSRGAVATPVGAGP